MLKSVIRKFFGSANDRIINGLMPIVKRINQLESAIKVLSDQELRGKTAEFKARVAEGESLDTILPEAFAVVREAAVRTLKMRHFDVQLLGGIIMHKGMIAEMKTGEGKTMVATLPCYLNALTGRGVHVVTVNEYLVKRDAEWMGQIHRFLGLTVGCIASNMTADQKREAYNCDITYGTNNEFGFDYLRDNLKFSTAEMAQRPFNFALIDEVDSILIDESRTPLIISGPAEDYSHLYTQIDKIIPLLQAEDYELDEKSRSVTLTDQGNFSVEKLLRQAKLIEPETGLYDLQNMNMVHHINTALKAHYAFTRDVDYIIKDNKVLIIDEFTGRIMEGRRFSEGLHQAIEAKEKVKIMSENQTLASITFQNYFRMYPKLAGMTGTAITEANEFMDIYKLEVVSVPTNIPVSRRDEDDIIYRTAEEKYRAIVAEIKAAHQKEQPVLLGTVSIEKSEYISKLLKKEGIKHNVLNARFHEKEAEIIAQAGKPQAVTVATNMAGRGTDIMLGGNPNFHILEQEKTSLPADNAKNKAKLLEQYEKDKERVKQAGGLLVIGTERHESRRIDNQLRGRSGRQGDFGRTVFFLSLEDDLMRLFGSEKISSMLQRLGLKDDEAITHSFISRSIAKAQQKVEARNYEARKNLLKFDDVMNQQRKVVYSERLSIMESHDVFPEIYSIAGDLMKDLGKKYMPPKSYKEEWDIAAFIAEVEALLNFRLPIAAVYDQEGSHDQDIINAAISAIEQYLEHKQQQCAPDIFKDIAKYLMLSTLDQVWKEHLHTLDHLRQGIYLRAYAQKDPLNEYKFEAFNLFKNMLEEYSIEVLRKALNINLDSVKLPSRDEVQMSLSRQDPANIGAQEMPLAANGLAAPIKRNRKQQQDPQNPMSWGRVMRNDPCPCGVGKKFKYCHGAL